jgi:hypothetical protein
MSTDTHNLPEEYHDAHRLPGNVAEAYILDRDDQGAPVRLAVVTYDPSPDCPLNTYDHGTTWAWVEGAPWWASGGTCDPFDVEHTPSGAFAFAIEEQRDGNHYYLAFPGGLAPAGFIVPPSDAPDLEGYARAVLEELTAWSTSDVYVVDVLERVTWERADGADGERVTWEPWDDPGCGGLYGIESARQYVAEECAA